MHNCLEQIIYSEWQETLSRDNNYNTSHVTNTENIVKLAQMIHYTAVSYHGPRLPSPRPITITMSIVYSVYYFIQPHFTQDNTHPLANGW